MIKIPKTGLVQICKEIKNNSWPHIFLCGEGKDINVDLCRTAGRQDYQCHLVAEVGHYTPDDFRCYGDHRQHHSFIVEDYCLDIQVLLNSSLTNS